MYDENKHKLLIINEVDFRPTFNKDMVRKKYCPFDQTLINVKSVSLKLAFCLSGGASYSGDCLSHALDNTENNFELRL